MDMESNVNTEMSDLVHQAENWVRINDLKENQKEGLNRVPENSIKELRLHKIEKQIITRAALMLLEQLGIHTVEEFKKLFVGNSNANNDNDEETIDVARNDDEASLTISPMEKEEFYNILKNGWHNEGIPDSPEKNSPIGARRRNSILADLIPMSPIASEAGNISPRKTEKPLRNVLQRRSAPNAKHLFLTSTPNPKDNTPRRRAYSLPKSEVITPSRTMISKLDKTPLSVIPGEGPLENRASRLRRLKMEEKRANGGFDRSFSNRSSSSISLY